MNQQKRLLDYLLSENRASTNEIRNTLSIAHPDTIVSRIRAIHGYSSIKGYWMDGKNKFGEKVRFMMYEISDELRTKLTQTKPNLPCGIKFQDGLEY